MRREGFFLVVAGGGGGGGGGGDYFSYILLHEIQTMFSHLAKQSGKVVFWAILKEFEFAVDTLY